MKKGILCLTILLAVLTCAAKIYARPNWAAPQSGTSTRNSVEIRWGNGNGAGDWEVGLRTRKGRSQTVSEGQYAWQNGQAVPFTFSFKPSEGKVTFTLGGVSVSHDFDDYAGKDINELHVVSKTSNNGNGDSWSCSLSNLSANGVSFSEGLLAQTGNGNGGQWITGTFTDLSNNGQTVTVTGNITFSWNGADPYGTGLETFFSLGEPYEPLIPAEITVTSPNGGETWYAGTTHDVTWTSSGVKKVKVYFSEDGGANWKRIKNAYALDGSFSWEVPDVQSSNCLIKIDNQHDTNVFDISDAPFTISIPPAVELISPNGGEQWVAGTRQFIRWNSRGLQTIAIEYSTDGSSWTSIDGAAQAAPGSYTWLVPETPSSDCRVRISGGGESDVSEGSFAILPAPSVTLTSPNGGEDWPADSQQNITWTSTTISNVMIQYTIDGSSWTTIEESMGAAGGTYSWTVPNTPSETCLVRIFGMNDLTLSNVTSAMGVSDVSDGVFTISPLPGIRVTSPNGGEEWYAGSTQDITWESSGMNKVNIEFSVDGVSWTEVASNVTALDGTYAWTVPNTAASSCVVRISSVSDPGVYDDSDGVFSILSIPTLTLTAPNGGEEWTVGEQHTITWTSAFLNGVRLEYSTNGTDWTIIEQRILASPGSYQWTIPDTPATSCLVRISGMDNYTITDESDGPFSILPAPSITVTSPNGGEQWVAETEQSITWELVNVDAVKIEYTADGVSWTTIAENIGAQDQTYTWLVPDTPSIFCRVKISSLTNTNVFDVSDAAFSIFSPPRVVLFTPNGGENWTAGTEQMILWKSIFIAAINIDFSSDGGSSWSSVAEGIGPNVRFYKWTVPNIQSSDCLIKVTDASNPNVTDQSDAVFTVTSAPTITVTAPNGGENWIAGSQQDITWTSSNVNTVNIYFYSDTSSTLTSIAEGIDAATGSFTWTVFDIEATNCLIRITDTSNPNITDQSNSPFTISAVPTITVTSPNGGENWTAGSEQAVTWTSRNVATIKIEFSSDGSTWEMVKPNAPAHLGTYLWPVPNVQSENCLIRITDTSDPNLSDVSDGPFTISPVPTITVVSPNGGENWTAGSEHAISWTSTNVDFVTLTYAKDRGPYITIAENVQASTGTYQWTVPVEPSDHYMVKILYSGHPNIYDTCDTFFTVSAPVETNIINLDTGAEYAELDAAVSEVQQGQTLEFRKSGTYFSKMIDIDKNNVTIQVASGLDVKLKGDWNNYCLKIEAEGVTVRDVTVFDSKKNAIWVTAHNVTLRNIAVRDYINKNGIFAENADGLKIYDSTFQNCGNSGITVGDSDNVTIDGATTPTFKDLKYGIIISACSDVLLSNLDIGTDWQDDVQILSSTGVKITGSHFTKSRYAIYVNQSSGVSIELCRIERAWKNAVYIENSTNSSIYRGTFDCLDKGVFFKQSTGMTVSRTTFSSSNEGAYGIHAKDCGSTTISGNLIEKMWSDGIIVDGTPGTDINHNIIREVRIGVNIGANSHSTSIINNTIVDNNSSGIYIKGAVENVTIKNNIIVKNAWDYWTWGIQCQNTNHPGLSITYNDVWNNREQYKNCSPGAGEISADPQFVANFGDVHLRQGSPCIDAGDPADPVGAEPEDNGDRINQGVYGGTSEAQTTSAQIFTIAEAASNGWISLYCYTWDGTQYNNISGLSNQEIEPWTGFWVIVNRDLDILFPPRSGQGQAPNQMETVLEPERYYLISTPLQASNPDVNAVFGDDLGDGLHDGAYWQFWRTSKYNYSTETYTRYTGTGSLATVLAGRGFWIYHYYPIPMNITVDGSPVSQSSNTEFKLPASDGSGTFHMVGNPFHYNMRWSDTMVRVPMTDDLPLGKVAKTSLPATIDELDAWHINLAVADPTGTFYDTDNRAGVVETGDDHHAALSTIDLFPFTTEYVRLVVRDPTGSDESTYAYDYQPPAKNEYQWEIELTTSFNTIDVAFDISNIDEVPADYKLTLTHPDFSTTEIDDDATLRVSLNNFDPKKYILTATRVDMVEVEETKPTAFGITNIAPNPFNPSTILTFTTENEGNVRARVFNLSGQVVATLVEEYLPAGRYSYVWDAKGNASGVYVMVLESRGVWDTRKVTLLK